MTKTFRFPIDRLVNGQWIKVSATGTAEILDRGFQTQLGADGYKAKVIESNEFAPGTIIHFFPWSAAR